MKIILRILFALWVLFLVASPSYIPNWLLAIWLLPMLFGVYQIVSGKHTWMEKLFED